MGEKIDKAKGHAKEAAGDLTDNPDLSQSWPGVFAPPLIARCQQDLRRSFPVSKST